MNILDVTRAQIAELKKAIAQIEKFKSTEPRGSLYIGGEKKPLYYVSYSKSGETTKKRYLKRSESKLIRDLATKKYYNKMLPGLRAELMALEKFAEKYHPMHKYEIYDEMDDIQKQMIAPLFLSTQRKIQDWQDEEYAGNEFHEENKIFETMRGEMVRSKSELEIANELFRSNVLDYKYEKPCYLNNSNYPTYPDFTTIHLVTGNESIFEHFGCMDDPEYARNFVKKFNSYVRSGYIPGVNFFFTFETRDQPLDPRIVRRIISIMEEGV